jgi:uncharacterized membrane-anchored protein YitT (DUF2179 family)
MYTLVTVFIGAKVIDLIQKGAYAAKAVTIISNLPAVVSKEIVLKMNRSTTLFNGKGGYSGENKEVVYCVVSRNEVRILKSIVHEIPVAAKAHRCPCVDHAKIEADYA